MLRSPRTLQAVQTNCTPHLACGGVGKNSFQLIPWLEALSE